MKRPNSLNSPGTFMQGIFDPITRSNRFFGLAAAAVILASLAINLGLGRWGSYIGTPIQILYLADSLLAVGAFLSLTQLRKVRLLPKTAWVFALPPIYILGQAIYTVGWNPSSDYTLWVRDMAPFAYLSLIPLIALSLAILKPQVLVWVIRWSAVTYAIGFTLSTLGLVQPWISNIIGSNSVLAFSYRGDFTGIAIGIGIVAWGQWSFNLNRQIFVQASLLAVGLLSDSQSAFLALIALTTVSLVKDWSGSKVRSVLTMVIVAFFAGILLSVTAQLLTQSRPVIVVPAPAPAPLDNRWSLPPVNGELIATLGGNSATARVDTAGDVLFFLATDRNWVLGGGPGSDALYFACTGIPEAPEKTVQNLNGQLTYLPKCGVDSSEASSTLRDPHNWALNLLLYHGFVGLLIFLSTLIFPIWTSRSVVNYRLSVLGIIGIFIVSSFSVVLSAPFGLVPLVALLAYLYANAIRLKTQATKANGIN